MNTPGPHIEHDPFFSSSPFEPTLPPAASLAEIDLTDPQLYQHGDPHAAWRMLRREAPIFLHTRSGARAYGNRPFWAVTNYEGVKEVIHSREVFSGVEGLMDLSMAELGIGGTIGQYEGDAHKHYRKAVGGYSSRPAMEKMAGQLEGVIQAEFAWFAQQERLDAADLALRLNPKLMNGFFNLSGDEAARIERIHYWTDFTAAGLAERSAFMEQTFKDLLASRRSEPREDIFTSLAEDEDSGRLSWDQVHKYLMNVLESSFLGIRSVIYNPIATLLHHPAQFELLKQHPEYIENGRAIEEQLRWAGFSMHLARQALSDTQVLGQKISKGDVVVAFHTSANRDEGVFEDPYVLDYSRQRAPILSFGIGPHQCLGMYFSRVVLKGVLRCLVKHFESMAPAGPMVRERAPTVVFSTISSLPMIAVRRAVNQ